MSDRIPLISITGPMVEKALIRSEKVAALNGSILGKPANYVGCLGEIVIESWLTLRGIYFVYEGAKKLPDYRVMYKGGEMVVEVKTKDRTVVPKRHYAATIPADQLARQHPDWFVFVSLFRPRGSQIDDPYRFTEAYIVGAFHGAEYKSKAQLLRAGDQDDGMTILKDCYNLPISYLFNADDMVQFNAVETGKEMEEWS